MNIFWWILLFSLVGGVFSLVGGVVLLFNEKWVRKNTLTIVSWSAGVLLSVSFLDLLPEALSMAGEMGITPSSIFRWPFLAMVSFFFLERSFVWFHHHHDPHVQPPRNLMLIIGDSLHNFIDGIVITTTFLISVPIGIVTSIAVAAHEIPQEIADFGLFLRSGMKKKKIFVVNFLSSMMTVLGAMVALYFSSVVSRIQPQLLAFAGGMFTYIAASDLIPELHHHTAHKHAVRQTVSFLAGILVTYLLMKLTHEWA